MYLYNLFGFKNSEELVYKYKNILEIPFYNDSNKNDNHFKIMNGAGGSFINYFILDLKTFTYITGQFPQLLCIKEGNFYFNSNFQGLRVYNNEGLNVYNIDYDPNYFVDAQSSKTDENNNLYMVMKNANESNDVFGYKVNGSLNDKSVLNKTEMENLLSRTDLKNLSVDKDLGVDRKNEKFKINPTSSDYSLTHNSEGRFLSVTSLNITKDEISVGKINIQDFPEKIIFTKLYYIDSDQNVYVIGFKSNQFDRIEDARNKIFKIKVIDPIFFVWKFEKQ